jgi:pyruvate, orthophosphate dikinase
MRPMRAVYPLGTGGVDSHLRTKSKALEINLADYHVDVAIDASFGVILEVMGEYYGLTEGVATFLRELSHPFRNWRFIVAEGRKYALGYVHLLRRHARGVEAAQVMIDILVSALHAAREDDTRSDAADTLLQVLHALTASDADAGAPHFRAVVLAAFERMAQADEAAFEFIVRSFYSVSGLARAVLRGPGGPDGVGALIRVVARFLERTYAFWSAEPDPQPRFDREAAEFGRAGTWGDLFGDISHARFAQRRSELEEIVAGAPEESAAAAERLLGLPGFHQIVAAYKAVPQLLLERGSTRGLGQHLKLVFLFQMMSVSGLALLHEDTLREINRTLTWIIVNDNYRDVQRLIRKTFSILKERAQDYPATALSCVLNMGQGVNRTDDIDLANFFIDTLIDFGFQSPMVQGVDDEWRTQVNVAHLQNVRTWLELIRLNPKRATRLLSALVIHLAVGGVHIRDNDLFPRDVTALLNSRVEPVFHLVKQLARLCPVFFNDLGAEGRLREVSTRIDDLCRREDALIHFLRKQSHVESSSRILPFMEAVFRFWRDLDKDLLAPFVPPSIYRRIDSHGPHVIGLHRAMVRLSRRGVRIPEDLSSCAPGRLRSLLGYVPSASESDLERLELAVEFYGLLCRKYRFDPVDLRDDLPQLRQEALPGLEHLEHALAVTDEETRLGLILDYLEVLKGVITSETAYEPIEDIYQKRHITIDIPSMYGSYHEMKFDCLGLSLRLESLANTLFENLVRETDFGLITQATFHRIHQLLKRFNQALQLDGIHSAEFERQLEFLEDSLSIKGFSVTQYLDIFKGFAQAVQNIVKDYFHNLHGANLTRILPRLRPGQLLAKYLPPEPLEEPERLHHRITEIFFRDRIASTLGLQSLDGFIGRVLQTLRQQAEALPPDQLLRLLLYEPRDAVVAIDAVAGPQAGVVHLGTKGFNLVKLHGLGFRVPPGFIVTTEVFRCRHVIEGYAPAQRTFQEQVRQALQRLEQATGKRFGDPADPLLLSVRSGSAVSQPGMMDTLLDVGNNEEITAAVAARTGNPWFAWDNYRRFLQNYGMAHDLTRDDFDAVIREFKRRTGVPLKRRFTGDQMRSVALAYRQLIRDAGIAVVDSPFEQLLLALRRVLHSWESPKAQAYRRIMGISDDWGTAVAVQAMVYGNRSERSGTGVVFTHNPRWSGEVLRLWGDFTTTNQGEDVVSGLVHTMPVSLSQQEVEMRDTDITLETHFPAIYRELSHWARLLIEDHGWSPQEIEFTFESPEADDLYMLQTRDMAIRESPKALRFDPEAFPPGALLGHGIGVSGGAMSGRVVFSLEDIARWRVREPTTRLILARTDTVPDDIREIHAADGLLTARGGVTSHAAVVAHRLGKTCVVGCTELVCDEREGACTFAAVVLRTGDRISIDGREGAVYRGEINVLPA